MKSVILLLTVAGLAAGYTSISRRVSTTEKPLHSSGKNQIQEKPELSPLSQFNPDDNDENGLIEVSEDQIPDGVIVYVLDELRQAPKQAGESMSTADNLVFRPLFQYRNRQEAIARRRAANSYRRRYFIQRRPYRNAYNHYYYTHRWH